MQSPIIRYLSLYKEVVSKITRHEYWQPGNKVSKRYLTQLSGQHPVSLASFARCNDFSREGGETVPVRAGYGAPALAEGGVFLQSSPSEALAEAGLITPTDRVTGRLFFVDQVLNSLK